MKLRFVTDNAHKLKEAQSILNTVEVIPSKLDIEEIQTDDVQRLVKDKLLKAFKKIGRPVFVEHTGLCIESLNGFPGGLTRIFWDKLEPERFCTLLGTLENTRAIAQTTIGYCDGKNIYYFDGKADGTISPEPKGDKELQWDCVFIPEGEEKTFAQSGEISMRKIAFEKFNRFLESGEQ